MKDILFGNANGQRTSLHKACFVATLDFLLTLPAYTTMYCDEISSQSVTCSLTTCMMKVGA